MKPNVESLWKPWTERSAHVPFKDPHKNVGNGERKVAAELGLTGIEMSTFDLLINGRPWEVKQLDGSDSVFVGKQGDQYAWKIRHALADALEEIEGYFDFNELDIEDLQEFEEYGLDWPYLSIYLHSIAWPIIWHGEIGKTAIDQTVRACSTVRDYLSRSCSLRPSHHEYIKDPNLIRLDWEQAAKPSEIFSKVDGVVIVSEEKGYAMIPCSDLDEYLKFSKISKGQVKVALKTNIYEKVLFLWGRKRNLSSQNSDIVLVDPPNFCLGEPKLQDPKSKSKPDGFKRSCRFVGDSFWYVFDRKIRRVRKGKRSRGNASWKAGTF